MKILIVSEYIAPVQAVAAIRWTKICKYIKKNHPDTHITVFTNQKEYEVVDKALNFQHKDPLLEKEMIYFDEYIAPPHSLPMRIYYRARQAGSKEPVAESKFVHNRLHTNKLKTAALELLYEMKTEFVYWQMRRAADALALDFDVVISSYGPIWTHMIAEYIKSKRSSIIWLADFRDQYATDYDSKLMYRHHKQFTMTHCASANAIIRVLDELKTFTPSDVPVYTIPNGFDPEERLNPFPPKKFSLVFTGLLYGKMRDIGIVCKAVRELCEENLLDKKDVEIAYAGPHGTMCRSLAATYDAEEYIHDYDIVPRVQALKMQQRAAILLQLNWNTQKEKCGWSGKMYEYMMAQKPIIYVVTGDVPYSEPSSEIHHLGGCCYEQCRHEETYPQMKAYILEKYQEWKTTGNVSVQQDKEYIEQYSYPHIVEQVWELIQTQTERKKSSESTIT